MRRRRQLNTEQDLMIHQWYIFRHDCDSCKTMKGIAQKTSENLLPTQLVFNGVRFILEDREVAGSIWSLK